MSAQVIHLEEDESVAVAVARAAASILDIPVDQLPPLEHTIDTNLLEQFNDIRSNESIVDAQLIFDYVGLTVSVADDDTIAIR